MHNTFSQNLVPNPSFENYKTLPCSWLTSSTAFTSSVEDWFVPTQGTADILSSLVNNTCALSTKSTFSLNNGQQDPRTGDVMAGIISHGETNYREYLEVKLKSPLVVGKEYYAEMYVMTSDSSAYSSSHLAMHFSDGIVSQATIKNLTVTPQIVDPSIVDKNLWHKVSGSFVATSPAAYLTVGNFNDYWSTNGNLYPSTRLIKYAYIYVDDILVEEQPCMKISSDTMICNGTSLQLEADSKFFTGWADSTDPTNIISTNLTYVVKPDSTTTYLAYSSCDTLSVTIQVEDIPQFTLGQDTSLCGGSLLNLDVTGTGDTYKWQDGSTTAMLTITSAGTYDVAVSNMCGTTTDTIEVTYLTQPIFNLGVDEILCKGDIKTLDVTGVGDTYLWQDGSMASSFQVSSEDEYHVTVTNMCGIASDTILIGYDSLATVNLGEDKSICSTSEYTLNAGEGALTYQWQDFSTSSTYLVSTSGVYWVEVSNDCGTSSDTVTIEVKECLDVKIPNCFTPNDDNENDSWTIKGLELATSYEIYIYNRWGNIVYENINEPLQWNGTKNGLKLPVGSYYYVAVIEGVHYTGMVNLIR